jgi:hypothetical protein
MNIDEPYPHAQELQRALLGLTLVIGDAQRAGAPMAALDLLLAAKAELLREEQARFAAAKTRRSA